MCRDGARPADGVLDFAVPDQHVCESNERRIMHHAAKMDFALEERAVILFDRVLDGVVLGIIRLDQDFTWEAAASGATGDLGEQLKRSFRRAKIRTAERKIC